MLKPITSTKEDQKVEDSVQTLLSCISKDPQQATKPANTTNDNKKALPQVTIGCSGGVDSMVLLYVLNRKLKEDAIASLKILHVNYGLRQAASDADQTLVESFAHQEKLTVLVKKPQARTDQKNSKSGLQAWARRQRYMFFEQETAFDEFLFLAHHKDDLLENIILRLLRGVPFYSLKGIKRCHGRVIRPFLALTKSELYAYAIRHKVPFFEDQTNGLFDYSRNRIRHLVLPELERVHQCALANVVRATEASEEIFHWCQKELKQKIGLDSKGAYILHQDLKPLPPQILKLALNTLAQTQDFVSGNAASCSSTLLGDFDVTTLPGRCLLLTQQKLQKEDSFQVEYPLFRYLCSDGHRVRFRAKGVGKEEFRGFL